MLAVSWDTVRLFLHVLAATVWVGGQLTLAALVPVLRRLGAEIPRAAARRFNQVAWPAFAVLILTGVWNVIAVRSQITGSYQTTLVVKLAAVAVSGITAVLHARARSAAGLAVFGALTGTAVAKTIASGLIDTNVIVVTSQVILCALGGGIAWNLITWSFGLPSSSSHALIGGVVGPAGGAAGVRRRVRRRDVV